MPEPKKMRVEISILGGGSIKVFDLDDEKSKGKVPKPRGDQREIASMSFTHED